MKKSVLLLFTFSSFFLVNVFAQEKKGITNNVINEQLKSAATSQQLHYPQSVTRFYRQNNYLPVWTNPQSRQNTGNAMVLLDCVLQYGLSHDDFHPKELQFDMLRDILENPGSVSDSLKAQFDVLLTDAVITMLNYLHYGKLNPDYGSDRVDHGMDVPFHAEAKLQDIIHSQEFTKSVLEVQPNAKLYTAFQEMLHIIRGQAPDDCYGTPGDDVMKIAVNMERIRWANVDDQEKYIQINIPTYELTFHLPDTLVVFKAIVGTPQTPSPTLQSQITYFTSFPDWLVPDRIFIRDILPKAIADSLFLDRLQISIYNKAGQLKDITNAQLKSILTSPQGYYAKQAPGCDNTLGSLVFHFQNVYNIYLNQIADQKLFEKDKRDLSNGCIWLDDAAGLAALLLKYDASEQSDKLFKILKKSKTHNFVLNKPVPIKITYLTCDIKKGELIRFEDIYNMDTSLELAIYSKLQRNTSIR
ncbi:L,D-transpeptidase family protein [Mucilaginibacter sp. NFR10]|uniref:L,D-transpeptidase family protein n=1 Tax=Mucilaginibacter sp. NFR10 TaxID=1566292 RepID=UPI000871529A|nr:L,D-transpeptidase family protein [Mucilaginibacter sp. NFR10]SCW50753.1 L,D-transpeptidase catalytic domain [Mucilaginibacter sp. NFR10]